MHTPFVPFSNSPGLKSIITLFERGRELERGHSPLSFKLPFPAIMLSEWLSLPPAGKWIKGIGK
jgi:hypothetical protein